MMEGVKNWYRNLRAVSVFVVFLVLFTLYSASTATVLAASTMIRLATHTSGSSPLPVLIQFTAGSAGTETGVVLDIDPAWSLAAVPGQITTSTASLPSGVVAWPGMGTAITVSGQEIQFPSTDITVGVTYGFYITGGIGANPAARSTNYHWQIRTVQGLSTIETSSRIGIPITTNSTIQVTASVLPQPSDLSVVLGAVGAPAGEIDPDTVLNYELTYENLYTASTPLTVQASWSLATLEGTSTPSIELLEYIPGSATDGYSGTTPVIDTLLRTITWTIPSLPTGSGPQTVTFSLKTTNYDSAAKQLSFTVSASAIAPISTVPSEITQLYRGAIAPTPAPTPTPSATATPTPATATPQPTSTPAPAPLAIQSVRILNISDSTAEIEVVLSEPAALTFNYRPSLSQISSSLRSPESKLQHTIMLSQLTKSTYYIFEVTAATSTSRTFQSDRYTFKTASSSLAQSSPLQGIRLTSEGVLITTLDVQTPPTLTIPVGSPLEITLQLSPDIIIQSLVLEQQLDDWQSQTSFEQTIGSEYIARFSPGSQGTMQLFVILQDYNGNYLTQPIANLVLVAPLRILDGSGRPVEFARIFIRKYNAATRLFEAIPPDSLIKNNPLLSNVRGEVPLILPIGSYQFDVSAPGFRPLEQIFSLASNSEYPVITLQSEALPFIGRIKHILYVANEMLELYVVQLRGSAISPSVYALATFFTSSFFLLLATIALAAKTHIAVWMLPEYLWRHSRLFTGILGEKKHQLRGQLVAKDTHKPISRALITLFDAQTDEVLATFSSDRRGYFHWQTARSHEIRGTASAIGYAPLQMDFSTRDFDEAMVFELEENPSVVEAKMHQLMAVGESMLGSFFETLLVLALILQVFFFSHINILMEVVLITGSMINLAVWSVYQATPHQHHAHRTEAG